MEYLLTYEDFVLEHDTQADNMSMNIGKQSDVSNAPYIKGMIKTLQDDDPIDQIDDEPKKKRKKKR